MFEKLVNNHCCNYSNRICLGALFKVLENNSGNYDIIHWIDKSKAGKQCLVTQSKRCDFFINVVLPALKNKNEYRDLIHKYENMTTERGNIEKGKNEQKIKIAKGYNLTCRNCGSKFRSDTPKQKYCEKCRVEIRRQTIKKSIKNRKRVSGLNKKRL